MSSNKVIFEQPGGNTGVNHDHPTAALHITQEHGHDTQPILKLESPDPTISFIDSTNPGKDLHMLWNGGGSQQFKWFMNDVSNPEMVLSRDGVLGVGVHSFTGVQDGSPSVLSDILEPKIYTDGSIQITNGTGAFVVGTGSGSFLRDEELGFGWGGGWYMTDNTYLRVRNNKHVYSAGGATFTGVTSNSNIEINSTTPVLVMKDTNATSAQTHNSYISFRSSENTERAWMGFGSVTDNKFRIVNKWETPVHIHGSSAGAEPLSTLIVQDNSESNHAGILIAGHSNKQTHLRFQHGDDLMWQWRVPMHSSSNPDSMRLYSWSAGGDVLTVDNSGNVGIGTTNPGAPLHILTSNTTDTLLLESTGDSNLNAPDLILYRNSATPADNDNLGIIKFRGVNDGTVGVNRSNIDYALIQSEIIDASNNAEKGSLSFWTRGVGSVDKRMTIDSDGNVGIGTASPSGGLLHLRQSGNDAIRLQREGSGSNDASIYLGHSGKGFGISTTGAIGTTDPDLFIDQSGKVGIGTQTPAYKLTLEESNSSTPCYLGITGGSSSVAALLLGDTSNKSIGRVTYSNVDNSMTFRTNGTDRVTIKSSGHTYVSGSVRSTHQVRASGWFTGDTAGHGPAAEIGISGDIGYLMNYNRSNSSYGTIIVQSRYGRARFDNDGLIRIGNHTDGTKQLHVLSQTGLFGVGKTPSYKLDVGGDINYTGKLMKNGSEQTTANMSNFVRKEGLGSANYYSADTWIEFRDTNAGLYWGGSQSTAGWHVYPNNENDLRLRSANWHIGIQLETSDLKTRGYVYANSSDEVGFLNKDRSWNFRLNGQKVTLGGPDTEWNVIHAVNGPNAIHFNRHDRFWIGAGNGTWFTGSANNKSQASGLNATYAHDLLITTMNSTSTHDRGITFAVATNDDKNAGYRLGKWHSGDAKDSSKLVVDGQIFAKAGNTDEYDYYGNNYSSYHSYKGGTAGWSGDSGYGWNVPGVVSSSALQIQSGNGGSTNPRKPQLQFHQYGYGGPAIQYDGPGKYLDIIAPTTRLSNSTGLRFRGQTVWHAGNDGSGSGLDADKLDGQHLDYFARKQHFRSVGAPAYTSSTTTAGLVAELHNEGMFQSYLGASKASWSYANNNNLTDAGRFKEIAGTSFLTWTDNTSSTYPGNITIMAICPNTGDSAGKMFVYNDQGSSYSPGWREIWTSRSDGSGSGLDADLLDGLHASSFIRADSNFTITKGSRYDLYNNINDWGFRFQNNNGTKAYVYMCDDNNGMHIRNDSSTTSTYLLDVYAANGNRFRVRGADALTTINGNEVIHTGNISSHVPTNVVNTTYNSSLNTDTRNSRGVTRLYRRDSNSDYSVQTDWTGSHWFLKGYSGDNFHGHCRVGYADTAGDASKLDGVDSTQFLRSDVSDTFSADLNSSGAARLVLKKTDNNLADHICFHNGSTRVGEIGCSDDTWLRINNHTAKNIYTPRMIRADGGFQVDGSTVIDASGGIVGSKVTGTVANADKLDNLHASSFLRSGSSTQNVYAKEFYCSSWFRNDGNAEGMYNSANDAHFYSAGQNYWHINGNSGNSDHGALVFYDRYNDSQGHATGRKGYVYWDSSGFGLLDNDGAWAVRVQKGTSPLELRCDNNVELEVHTSYVKANGSFRAPNFYVDGNIYHNGDTNTYVGFHAADQFRVVCNGSEQMEWGNGYTLLNDNKTLRFGSSSDFRQWFDGTNMYFRNYAHSGGNIYFQGEDPNGHNKGLLYMHNDVAGGSYLRLFYNGGDRMRTSATGIDVYGGTGTEGGQINLKYNSSYANHVSIDVIRNTGQYDGTTSDWYWRVFNDTISPVYQMLFNTRTGDFEVSGDVISFGDSDIKLKDNLQLIQNPVDKIKQLNGYTFTWNDESTKSGKHDIGVVAQEVEAVFPELVKTKLTGHKGVSYEKLTAVLIAGVNQQQEQIEQQQKQIDQLSEQIKQLIDRIEK